MDQTLLDSIKDQKEKINQLKEEFKAVVKDKFLEIAKGVFTEHPILYSFAWNQYTPYFNDGDSCEFSANTDYLDIRFKGEEEKAIIDSEEYELAEGFDHENSERFCDSFDRVWDANAPNTRGGKGAFVARTTPLTEQEAAAKAALDFLAVFDDEDLRGLFGDHVTVIVSVDGVRTEDCEHE